jgi:hypothetical protein
MPNPEKNFLQGVFSPRNPKKYKGDPTKIIYRSSWERKFMNYCDTKDSIVEWSSESTVVPYLYDIDGKKHRYFIDFRITVREKDNRMQTYLVEIKPKKQTTPPKQPKRKTKTYLYESFQYVKNQNKWDAARKYAEARGWKFIILTETDLGIKN